MRLSTPLRAPVFLAPRLLMLLALSSLLSQDVRATNAQPAVGAKGPKSVPELVADLSDPDAPDRLFAARSLRRQVKRALRRADGREGSESADDGLSALANFDQLLAPRCIDVIGRHDNITAHCADILGGLETLTALPVLQAAEAAETRPRPKRKIALAIQSIERSRPPNP